MAMGFVSLTLCVIMMCCTLNAQQIAAEKSEKIVYREDLPEGVIVNQQRLDELKESLSASEYGEENIETVDQLIERLHTHRATDGVSDAWCCRFPRPVESLQKPVVRARTVNREIQGGHSVRCGWFGTSRCWSSRTTIVTVTEYYEDYEWLEVPSREWNNGCPEHHIICCDGYIFRDRSDNCLSHREYEELILLQLQYCHFDLGLLDIFTPMPYSYPCPTVTTGDRNGDERKHLSLK